jgi:tetratricopeptide (TPR) repeat protein
MLYQQRKFSAAEGEFRRCLAEDPQYGAAHSWLALAVVDQKKYDEAEREARQGVHLAPDQAFSHYALAHVLNDRRRLDESERAAREAIRIDPTFVDAHALVASVLLERKQWRAAVDAANLGLQFDPENVTCANIRAIGLRNLGDTEAADRTVDRLLERAPENAVAHANQGWALLSAGDHRQAMESFREALRLDPNMEWARLGLINSMKARNFIFRYMLQFFLFMGRLSSGAQWGLIVGFYVAVQFLRGLARSIPELAPFVLPVLAVYLIFVYLTWTANPLFNLLLRLDRFGRHALSREEITASNWVGACFLGAIGGLVAWLITRDERGLVVAAMCALIVIPVAAVFNAARGWPRNSMTGYVGVLAVAGIVSLIGMSFDPEPAFTGPLFGLFLLGSIFSGWVANGLAMARPTR